MTPPPPLRLTAPRTLFVFESAARNGSFSVAAREFNVTQPSVSRAIAQLEAELGLRLFDRGPTGTSLTLDGQRILAAVTEGFTTIDRAIREARNRQERVQVMLSFSSSFATHWLVPRLRAFNAAFPTVELRLDLVQGMLAGVPPAADIATRIIRDDDPRFHAWPFAPEIILPVCSPDYLAERGLLRGDPARHVFLTLDGAHRDHWRQLAGCRPGEAGGWHSFSDYSVALQAAANGEGIALGWVSVVSRALCEGRLVRASDAVIRTGRVHSLIAPKSRPLRPEVPQICAWLVARMAEDLEIISI